MLVSDLLVLQNVLLLFCGAIITACTAVLFSRGFKSCFPIISNSTQADTDLHAGALTRLYDTDLT